MDKPFINLILEPGRLPELNGVANAIAILEMVKDVPQTIEGVQLKDMSIRDAIEMLHNYCTFYHAFDRRPQFWHEWKAANGVK